MAYTDDEELKRKMGMTADAGQEAGAGATPPPPGSAPPASPMGVSGSPQTAGVGAGGQSNWTNFQAYLKANSGNTGSSKLLTDKTESVFGKEKEAFTGKANETKSQADQAVASNRVGQDQASQLIERAGTNYRYDGQPHGSGYNDSVGKLKGSLSAAYQGPTSFAYGTGADTQAYGDALKQQGTFNQLMDNLYTDAAGGRIGKGQLALQRQIDVGDTGARDALTSARQRALQGYSGLQNEINQGVTDTNTALSNYAKQFEDEKAGLKGYIETQGKQRLGSIDNAVSEAEYRTNQFINGNKLWNVDDYLDPMQAAGLSGGQIDAVRNNPDLRSISNVYVGDRANRENIGGVGQDRSQYNAIMDVLGLSERIGQSASPWKLGDLNRSLQYQWKPDPSAPDAFGRYNKDLKGEDWLRSLGLLPTDIDPGISNPRGTR